MEVGGLHRVEPPSRRVLKLPSLQPPGSRPRGRGNPGGAAHDHGCAEPAAPMERASLEPTLKPGVSEARLLRVAREAPALLACPREALGTCLAAAALNSFTTPAEISGGVTGGGGGPGPMIT